MDGAVAEVAWYLDGEEAGSGWEVSLSPGAGVHTVQVNITDDWGGTASASAEVIVRAAEPWIHITSPAHSLLSPGNVTVAGFAGPGNTTSISVNGSEWAAVPVEDGRFTYTFSAYPGNCTVVVKHLDITAEVHITVIERQVIPEVPVPYVRILSPSEGAVVADTLDLSVLCRNATSAHAAVGSTRVELGPPNWEHTFDVSGMQEGVHAACVYVENATDCVRFVIERPEAPVLTAENYTGMLWVLVYDSDSVEELNVTVDGDAAYRTDILDTHHMLVTVEVKGAGEHTVTAAVNDPSAGTVRGTWSVQVREDAGASPGFSFLLLFPLLPLVILLRRLVFR